MPEHLGKLLKGTTGAGSRGRRCSRGNVAREHQRVLVNRGRSFSSRAPRSPSKLGNVILKGTMKSCKAWGILLRDTRSSPKRTKRCSSAPNRANKAQGRHAGTPSGRNLTQGREHVLRKRGDLAQGRQTVLQPGERSLRSTIDCWETRKACSRAPTGRTCKKSRCCAGAKPKMVPC